jgi:hypothetical protein
MTIFDYLQLLVELFPEFCRYSTLRTRGTLYHWWHFTASEKPAAIQFITQADGDKNRLDDTSLRNLAQVLKAEMMYRDWQITLNYYPSKETHPHWKATITSRAMDRSFEAEATSEAIALLKAYLDYAENYR